MSKTMKSINNNEKNNSNQINLNLLIVKEIKEKVSLTKFFSYIFLHIYSIGKFILVYVSPPIVFVLLYLLSFIQIVYLEKYDFNFSTQNLIILIFVNLVMTIIYTIILTKFVSKTFGKKIVGEDIRFFLKFIDTILTIIVSIIIAFFFQSISLDLFSYLSLNKSELEFFLTLITFMFIPVKLICVIGLFIFDSKKFASNKITFIDYSDVASIVDGISENKLKKNEIINDYKTKLNTGKNICPETFLKDSKINFNDSAYKSLIAKLTKIQLKYKKKIVKK